MNSGTRVFHSMHYSMMLRMANIWSIHPLPFLKPACSSLSFPSILFTSILLNTLLGTDSNVIPLQMSHICRPSFFWQFNNDALGPIVWKDFIVQDVIEELLHNFRRCQRYNISSWIESIPCDLPFLRSLLHI